MGQPAARIGDLHRCPLSEGSKPHQGGAITTGCARVLIGGSPAARIGDTLGCNGPPDTITEGEPTVLIGGQPAARLGDKTRHGGRITAGLDTVLIGEHPQGQCLKAAAAEGTPFVEMGE